MMMIIIFEMTIKILIIVMLMIIMKKDQKTYKHTAFAILKTPLLIYFNFFASQSPGRLYEGRHILSSLSHRFQNEKDH